MPYARDKRVPFLQSFRRAFAAPLNISTRDISIVAAGDTRNGTVYRYSNASEVNADDNAYRRRGLVESQTASESASSTPAPAAALPGSVWIEVRLRATTSNGADAVASGVASSPDLLPSLQSIVAANADVFGGNATVHLGPPSTVHALPPAPAQAPGAARLSSAAIAGVAVAAAALLVLCCVLLACWLLLWRRRGSHKG